MSGNGKGSLSPMIKSNGFSGDLQNLSYSPTKKKVGDFRRYDEPLSPNKAYLMRGRERRSFV